MVFPCDESLCSVVHNGDGTVCVMLTGDEQNIRTRPSEDDVMSTVWIVVGLMISGVLAAIVRWRKRARDTDLGAVSNQWVAEQRLSDHHTDR